MTRNKNRSGSKPQGGEPPVTRVAAPRPADGPAPAPAHEDDALDPTPQEVAEAAPAAPIAEVESSPLGYTPIVLPSRGVLYGPQSPLPTPELPGGVVEIRKMRMAEEEALWGGGGDTLSKLSKIIRAVTRLPKGFDPQDMLITDRFMILIALRRLGLGSKYTVQFRCSECNAQNKTVIDIVEELEEDAAPDDLREPVFVTLPDANVQVGLRFRRGIDEVEVTREARRNEARGKEGGEMTAQLSRQIMEIDGEVPTPFQKMDLMKRITQTDLRDIRLALEKHEPGINTTVYQECRRCQFMNDFSMPFTNEFFRPAQL